MCCPELANDVVTPIRQPPRLCIVTEPVDEASAAAVAAQSRIVPPGAASSTTSSSKSAAANSALSQVKLVRRAQKKFDRVRLINEELDRLTIDVGERTLSVTNKASFLAVAAGVLIAATTSQLWTRFQWFGAAGLVLACLGLLCAAVALRPARRYGILAQRLTDSYIDSTKLAQDIEAILVRTKSDAITRREGDLVARARWVWAGFGALVLSAISLSIVFSAQLLGG
jgi:hypothetical protein